MDKRRGTVLCLGKAKLPAVSPAQKLVESVAVALEIDTQTHKIVQVSFPNVQVSGIEDFFQRLLVESSVEHGSEQVEILVEQHFFSWTKRAVIIAVRDAVQHYHQRGQHPDNQL